MTASPRRLVKLGDVAELDIDRVPVVAAEEYRIVGVLNAGRGLFWREAIKGADTNYPNLHKLRAGQLVYRKLTAWEGPITTVPQEFDGGFVSSEFPTFTLDTDQLLPEYLALLCQQPILWHEIKHRSTGTAERRNRLNPAELLQISLELPGRDEQHRIVSVAHTLERAIDTREHEVQALEQAFVGVRERLLSKYPLVVFEDLLATIEAGKSPKAENRAPEGDERGVLKVSAIRPGAFLASEAKALPAGISMPTRCRVNHGDVLLTRASGSLKLVGSTCRVESAPRDLYLSDKTLRLVPKNNLDPDFLVLAMGSQVVREQIELSASGSSGQKNISQGEIRELQIPVPPDAEVQRSAAAELRTLNAASSALAAEARCLREVRAHLMDELLSGHREAPDLENLSSREVHSAVLS